LSTSELVFLLLLVPGAEGIETIERAVNLVAERVMPVYRSWAKPECLSFMAEGEIRRDFDVAIRERHSGACGGDPRTSPVVDRFRVRRGNGEILWMDPASGDYVPFGRFAERRR
jgi:hypothetical protein